MEQIFEEEISLALLKNQSPRQTSKQNQHLDKGSLVHAMFTGEKSNGFPLGDKLIIVSKEENSELTTATLQLKINQEPDSVDQNGIDTRIWQKLVLKSFNHRTEFIDDLEILEQDSPESE